MKRFSIWMTLVVSCLGLSMAQTIDSIASVVEIDSAKILSDTTILITKVEFDSLEFVDNDTILSGIIDSIQVSTIVNDSLSVLSNDSTLLLPKDSTALIIEKVKAVTEMISAKSLINSQLVQEVFSDTAIVNKYNRLLDEMVAEYKNIVESISDDDSLHYNPYFFRLFAPLTLYSSPISNVMMADTLTVMDEVDSVRLISMSSGRDLRLMDELDRVLLSTYLASPTLVLMTEEELLANQSVSEEAIKSTSGNVKLDVPINLSIPLTDSQKADLNANMVVHKPNFWKTKGSFSTQMTESFFSDNWYQGGTNNINMLSSMTLEANYNNKKKVQWSNKLEARIGFYQNQGQEVQSNQDLLRFTSKLNLKAVYNWNYTVEAQGNTQMMQHFNNDNTLKSRFMTPADASLTIGMDFKKNFKKGSLSIFPGPLSYKVNYVANKDLAQRYGIDEGKKARHDIGSKLQIDFNYKITPNISYKTRFYYYTPYDYVQMDWENTFNFQVSKYISTTLFFHTRFDDHVSRNEKMGFFQFKEYLTFGLNYSW